MNPQLDYYIYMFLAFICLIFSLFHTDIKRRYISIYFAMVILVDGYMGIFYEDFLINVHSYAIIFYVLFFIYYYRKELGTNTTYLVGISTLVFTLYINNVKESDYDIYLLSVMFIYYTTLPLLYFYKQIVKVDEVNLIHKQKFWFSTSLLLWIVFFAFRVIPFYFLVENNYSFIETLDFIFGIANIISYILFLIGILAKHE